jgi:CheY-like chemotaxis protein
MNATLPPLLPTQAVPIPMTRRTGKILVVDDEPAVCRFIELGLRNAGFNNLIFSANGSNVPHLALAERPDLIIMDVMMPGGNGLKALRILRSTTATASIPVIITSGFNVPTVGDCEQSRPDRVLNKPFNVEQLLRAVGGLLQPSGHTQAITSFPDFKAIPA